MSANVLLGRAVDKSMLERGFAIPSSVQATFANHLRGGVLAHGEKRTINLFVDGEAFAVRISSSGFDRLKNPNHAEQWQILYPKTGLAKKIRELFAAGRKFFTLYPTDRADTFRLEPELAVDEPTLEKLLELPTLTDPQAALIERFGLMRLRKLNRDLIDRLKRNYDYRCQICGRSFGEFYGVDLAECHHIEPFSRSLNNDANNLLIVCPNHHRIIHAASPTFDRARKLYLYQNGREEPLQLNEHL